MHCHPAPVRDAVPGFSPKAVYPPPPPSPGAAIAEDTSAEESKRKARTREGRVRKNMVFVSKCVLREADRAGKRSPYLCFETSESASYFPLSGRQRRFLCTAAKLSITSDLPESIRLSQFLNSTCDRWFGLPESRAPWKVCSRFFQIISDLYLARSAIFLAKNDAVNFNTPDPS